MKIHFSILLALFLVSLTAQCDTERLIQPSYKKGEITALCKKAIERHSTHIDEIASLPSEKQTFENTLVSFERSVERYFDSVLPLFFMADVVEDKGIRQESQACNGLSSALSQQVYGREDLARIFRIQDPQTAEGKRLKEKTLESFESKTKLGLSPEKKAELTALSLQLNEQSSLFQNNLVGSLPTLEFSSAQLQGVPQNLLAHLKKTPEGKWLVPANESYLSFASQSETRRKLLEAIQTRGGEENLSILQKIVELRQKIATLEGHPDWLDLQAEFRMAKNSNTIRTFLTELGDRVQKKRNESIAELLKIKQLSEPETKEVYAWDISYLENELKKQRLDLDKAELQAYFPTSGVVKNLLSIYSKMFKVEFVKVENSKFWAKEVEAYEIRDADDHHTIAYFYLDLYNRPVKEDKSYVTTLRVGRIEDGKLVHPVSVMVGHLPKPSKNNPSLLTQDDLVGLIAKFDFIFHQSFTAIPYGTLSGWNIDWNFVFTSAIMFQNLYYTPEFLEAVSGHFQDPKKKLPPDLIQKIVKSGEINQTLALAENVALSLTELDYYTVNHPDLVKIYKENHKKWVGIDALTSTLYPASWSRIVTFGIGNYCFLWARVYAYDLFSRFEKEGVFNPEVGLSFRKRVYEKGGLEDPLDLMEAFLERKVNLESFYHYYNI